MLQSCQILNFRDLSVKPITLGVGLTIITTSDSTQIMSSVHIKCLALPVAKNVGITFWEIINSFELNATIEDPDKMTKYNQSCIDKIWMQ